MLSSEPSSTRIISRCDASKSSESRLSRHSVSRLNGRLYSGMMKLISGAEGARLLPDVIFCIVC